jgi:hypothetical protein
VGGVNDRSEGGGGEAAGGVAEVAGCVFEEFDPGTAQQVFGDGFFKAVPGTGRVGLDGVGSLRRLQRSMKRSWEEARSLRVEARHFEMNS